MSQSNVMTYYTGLNLLRKTVGLLVFYNGIIFSGYGSFFFGNDSIIKKVPTDLVFRVLYYPMLNHYILEYTPLILAISGLFYFFYGTILLEIATAYLFYFQYLKNPLILDGSDNLIAVIFPFLIITNTKSYCSINKISNFFRIEYKLTDIGRIAIKIQFCVVYFFAGLSKLMGVKWQNGTALYYILNVDEFSFLNGGTIFKNEFLCVIGTYFTFLFEIFAVVLIWNKKTLPYVIILGILLHLSIFAFMRIDNFAFIMIGIYFTFISDNQYFNFLNLFYEKRKRIATIFTRN
ncbi:MAG: HTTM domain-containing protein [Chitinophagales bacterium]|jgi:hypothetical protein